MTDIDTESEEAHEIVYFENAQWRVTDHGMEGVGEHSWYHFSADRLLEQHNDGNNGKFYNWPLHMAEKTWVDTEAFIQVFAKAVDIHSGRYSGEVNEKQLERSFEMARKITADRYKDIADLAAEARIVVDRFQINHSPDGECIGIRFTGTNGEERTFALSYEIASVLLGELTRLMVSAARTREPGERAEKG